MLCVIIAILLVMVMYSPVMTKEACNLAIDDNKLNAGDSLVVRLTDGDGNPISNETVNIKITDEDGKTIDDDSSTDSEGNAKFDIGEEGSYTVECGFDGNGKFASSSTAANVTVEKATTKVVSEEQSSTSTHPSKYDSDGSIFPEYGPEVDSYGVTREYAIANNMHYLELEIDGKTVGGYTAYDPAAGCYHT